jgi:hypothetical protein
VRKERGKLWLGFVLVAICLAKNVDFPSFTLQWVMSTRVDICSWIFFGKEGAIWALAKWESDTFVINVSTECVVLQSSETQFQ